eukprot:COSAG05_NODE_45_length_25418_cov_92.923299_17_plen_155_part_00
MFINGQLVRHASYTYTAPPGGTPSHPRARKHNGRPIGQTCRHGSGCRSDSVPHSEQGGTRRHKEASERITQTRGRTQSKQHTRQRQRQRENGGSALLLDDGVGYWMDFSATTDLEAGSKRVHGNWGHRHFIGHGGRMWDNALVVTRATLQTRHR